MRHPNPRRELYIGIREGDLAGKAYAAFFCPTMARLPAHARDALLHGPVAEPLIPRLADAPRLLREGYHDVEDGFTLAKDGSIAVAVRTEMPGVSPEMVDWWFGWHGSEAQRYKLWHPRAHVHAEWGSPDPPGKQGRERYVGRTSYVDEYIGSRLNHAAIRFLHPPELGFDEGALRDAEKATVVCAKIGLVSPSIEVGYLVHHVRRVSAGRGSEMRSRFWLGGPYSSIGAGRVVDALAARAAKYVFSLNEGAARDLLVHCSQEMSHLASFLPNLYAELKSTR